PSQRFNRIRPRRRFEFNGRNEHLRRIGRSQRQHRHAVERGADHPLALVRRRESRDEEDSIQGEGVRHRFGHREMAAVNRIERAAVNSDASPQTFLVHEPDPIKNYAINRRPLKRLSKSPYHQYLYILALLALTHPAAARSRAAILLSPAQSPPRSHEIPTPGA